MVTSPLYTHGWYKYTYLSRTYHVFLIMPTRRGSSRRIHVQWTILQCGVVYGKTFVISCSCKELQLVLKFLYIDVLKLHLLNYTMLSSDISCVTALHYIVLTVWCNTYTQLFLWQCRDSSLNPDSFIAALQWVILDDPPYLVVLFSAPVTCQ